MKSPAHDTALFLADLGDFGPFGGGVAWSVYVGREPLTPVDVVTVYDTGGLPDTLVDDVQEPTIQVRVRAADYVQGYAKAQAARRALQAAMGVAIEGGQVVQWIGQGNILYIGRDDRDRCLFTDNYRVMREYL